ncbi:MAG: hypothetical protein JXA52_02785 [Planctomycetes bacterium]|nr:hypothetical protein [Planctomycetota bacterium]
MQLRFSINGLLVGFLVGFFLFIERDIIGTLIWLSAGKPDLFFRGEPWSNPSIHIMVLIIYGVILGLLYAIIWGITYARKNPAINLFKLSYLTILSMAFIGGINDYYLISNHKEYFGNTVGSNLTPQIVVFLLSIAYCISKLINFKFAVKQPVGDGVPSCFKKVVQSFLRAGLIGIILEFERQAILTQIWLNGGCPELPYSRGWDFILTLLMSFIFGIFYIGLPLGLLWIIISFLRRITFTFFRFLITGLIFMGFISSIHDYFLIQNQRSILPSIGLMLPELIAVIGLIIYSLIISRSKINKER